MHVLYHCLTIALSTKPTRWTLLHSPLLKSANISRSDSTIIVDCQFTETHPKASCVLVYREYDSPLLTVIDIPQFFDFPVSLTVESPENYTFVLFGKDSVLGMEEEPVARVMFRLRVTGELALLPCSSVILCLRSEPLRIIV